jgi:Enoyl-[acyl-carrier-protein] reductase (NADH)
MNRTFELYTDQLKKIINQVEELAAKNPLALNSITLVVSDDDHCLKLFQRVGHDWIYLDGEQFRERM